MSNGPIEFASDGPVDDKGPTEYGGRAGLIQGGRGVGEVHELTPSEKRGLIVRAEPGIVVDPVTGLVEPDPTVSGVDPVTEIVVEPGLVVSEPTEKPVEAPPRTGDSRSTTL